MYVHHILCITATQCSSNNQQTITVLLLNSAQLYFLFHSQLSNTYVGSSLVWFGKIAIKQKSVQSQITKFKITAVWREISSLLSYLHQWHIVGAARALQGLCVLEREREREKKHLLSANRVTPSIEILIKTWQFHLSVTTSLFFSDKIYWGQKQTQLSSVQMERPVRVKANHFSDLGMLMTSWNTQVRPQSDSKVIFWYSAINKLRAALQRQNKCHI